MKAAHDANAEQKGGYMKKQVNGVFEKLAGASIATAVIMIILGCMAMLMPYFTGIAFSVVFGWIIVIGGLFHFADAFTAQ